MICFSYSLNAGGFFCALGPFDESLPLAPADFRLAVGEFAELLAPDNLRLMLVAPLPLDSLRSTV